MATEFEKHQVELFKNIVGMLDILRAQGFPDQIWYSFANLRAQAIQHINMLEKQTKK